MPGQTVKTTSSQVMELQELIAGPLIATVEADALSSRKYLDCLMQTAFESYDPVTGKTGSLRYVTFTYDEQYLDGERRKKVGIPLLTLVPLPLLQIQEADFDFDIKIIDAVSETVTEKFSVRSGRRYCEQPDEGGLRMRASLAPQLSSKTQAAELQQSLAANMKIKVRMGQADMPAGLSNLLHLTANGLLVEDADNQADGGRENE